MRHIKWIAATMALLIGLVAGAFAQDQRGDGRRDNDRKVYTQPYSRDSEYGRTRSYRDEDGNRDVRRDRDRDRDRDRHGSDRRLRDGEHRDGDHDRRQDNRIPDRH